MIEWTTLKALSIPEGEVIKAERGTEVMWEKTTARIPSEYQEVEWIGAESNVGAYIDLGFTFDTAATIYLDQYITSTSITSYFFGATENSGALRCILSSPYSGGAEIYGSDGTKYIQNQAKLINGFNEIEMVFKKGDLSITNLTNGSKNERGIINTQAAYTMTNNLYLFAQNYNGTVRYGNVRRGKTFKYYDKNNELICDLVACYRKSDGEIGMYDKVRKLFLTNDGTGAFTKGPDV